MRLALFSLLTLCFQAQASVPTPVFVLHAYSQEYQWSKGQHEGLVRTLNDDTSRAYALNIEYLDTKRAGYNSAYAYLIADHLRQKYKGYQPAAVYDTDDNALSFALSHRLSIMRRDLVARGACLVRQGFLQLLVQQAELLLHRVELRLLADHSVVERFQ